MDKWNIRYLFRSLFQPSFSNRAGSNLHWIGLRNIWTGNHGFLSLVHPNVPVVCADVTEDSVASQSGVQTVLSPSLSCPVLHASPIQEGVFSKVNWTVEPCHCQALWSSCTYSSGTGTGDWMCSPCSHQPVCSTTCPSFGTTTWLPCSRLHDEAWTSLDCL